MSFTHSFTISLASRSQFVGTKLKYEQNTLKTNRYLFSFYILSYILKQVNSFFFLPLTKTVKKISFPPFFYSGLSPFFSQFPKTQSVPFSGCSTATKNSRIFPKENLAVRFIFQFVIFSRNPLHSGGKYFITPLVIRSCSTATSIIAANTGIRSIIPQLLISQ